jgi:hypothetical protein
MNPLYFITCYWASKSSHTSHGEDKIFGRTLYIMGLFWLALIITLIVLH